MLSLRNSLKCLAALAFLSIAATAQTTQPSDTSSDDRSVADALEDIRSGDVAKGMEILRNLGEQANPLALFHLAEMARIGIGREQSMPIAIMYYRLSGQMGVQRAALKLANILYFDGDGSPAELAEAVDIWQTYALKGDAESSYLLGNLYWNGDIGGTPDPIRGYGLVWRAAQTGYNDAVQTELTMRAQLNGTARARGEAYGKALETEGFNGAPLALELLVEGYTPDVAATAADKPEDWARMWRLEVGFAMREEDAVELMARIRREEGDIVAHLYSEVIKSPNRIGLYRLVFGPIESMNDAVSRCVSLKRAGHDCFAQPPSAPEE